MELIRIYQCLCDPIRLRVLHLLSHGPLCVCHLQEILDVPQAKVSQHLSYLRKRNLAEAERHGVWMIYSLPAKPSRELEANLKCLQDCVQSDQRFRSDLARLAKIKARRDWADSPINASSCC